MRINKKAGLYILYSLIILILFFIQDIPGFIPSIAGSKPILLISAALALSSVEKPVAALIFGAACGFLIDVSSDAAGYFAISLTVLCFIEAELFERYFSKLIPVSIAYAAAACTAAVGMYFVIFRIFAGCDGLAQLFLNHYISRICGTFLCFIPLYFLIKVLNTRILNKSA